MYMSDFGVVLTQSIMLAGISLVIHCYENSLFIYTASDSGDLGTDLRLFKH